MSTDNTVLDDSVLVDASLIAERALQIGPDSVVSIVHDGQHDRDVQALKEAAERLGSSVSVWEVAEEVSRRQTHPNVFSPPPPPEVTKAMAKSDAVLLLVDLQYLLDLFYANYDATMKARAHGARIVVPELPLGELNSSPELMTVITRRVELARGALDGVQEVHITSPGGTDVRVSLAGRAGVVNAPITPPGEIISLVPHYGEVAYPPVETTGDGMIVIDGAMLGSGVGPHREDADEDERRVPTGYIGETEEPIKLVLEGGRCVKVEGGKEADWLRQRFDEIPRANRIAEFALGLSETGPFAKPGMTAHLGTVHFAFGDNTCYGGAQESALHQNGAVRDASIYVVDTDTWILKHGNWQLGEGT